MNEQDFAWVEVWVKEQRLIAEIKGIEQEMVAVAAAPKSQKEVLLEVSRFYNEGDENLREVLQQFQGGEIEAITQEALTPWLISRLLTVDVVGQAVEGLPKGLDPKEKKAQIASLQAKIERLLGKIEAECWPPERGKPEAGADEWQNFIFKWAGVIRQYWAGTPLGLGGAPIKPGDPLHSVFYALGLDKIGRGGFFQADTLAALKKQG